MKFIEYYPKHPPFTFFFIPQKPIRWQLNAKYCLLDLFEGLFDTAAQYPTNYDMISRIQHEAIDKGLWN